MICPIKETAGPDVSPPGGGRGWAGTGVTGDVTGHGMGPTSLPIAPLQAAIRVSLMAGPFSSLII